MGNSSNRDDCVYVPMRVVCLCMCLADVLLLDVYSLLLLARAFVRLLACSLARSLSRSRSLSRFLYSTSSIPCW